MQRSHHPCMYTALSTHQNSTRGWIPSTTHGRRGSADLPLSFACETSLILLAPPSPLSSSTSVNDKRQAWRYMTATTAGPRIVIIGAGPTGLGAALRCEDLGHHNWVLIDSAPEQGGLSRSYVDDKGFTWDLGGHVIFSHYAYFDDAMDYAVQEWNTLERESWVWVEGVWVPYPFQNNIHRLPNDAKQKALEGLLDVHRRDWVMEAGGDPAAARPKNFEEYFMRQFGEGISDIFMRPYNFKVWAVPPSLMSTEWTGERVATVDVKRVCKNIIHNTDDLGWGPNATFRFPKQGGTGGIWTNLAKRLPQANQKIGTGNRMLSVDAEKKELTLESGETIGYDFLLTTVAIDDLLRTVKKSDVLFGEGCGSCLSNEEPSAPPCAPQSQWPDIASKFVFSATNVIGFGIKSSDSEISPVDGSASPPPHLRTKCWMYFPESSSPFYRCTVFSNYASTNAPAGHWSLMLEVSESAEFKPVDQATLIQECLEGCYASNLLRREGGLDEVVSTWSIRLPKGYPTPFIGRNELLNSVQPALKRAGIYSRGRFGGWKYEVGNQDHSMMQGVEAVEEMLGKGAEITYPSPSVVNATKETTRRLSLLK